MTHIAIYLPSLRGGGAERVMVTLANGFVERGLKVDLVLANAEGPYLSEVSSDVNIVNLGSHRVLASLPRLVRYLRKARPKSMLSALSHANVIAVIARILARVPVRLIVSERNNVSLPSGVSRSMRSYIVYRMMRWAYRRADGITAVSGGVADDLAKTINLSRERVTVVYNPVVTPGLIEKSKMPLSHPWLEKNEPPVILAVGRLAPQKDFATLIHAFVLVRAQRPCRLVILGEGELRKELQTLVQTLAVQEDVLLPGFAENPFAWMSRVQLFVLSSRWEGLPNVLIQAMACGASVVSTDCPSGPDEILEGGKWGKLVPVGNIKVLAKAISASLKNNDINTNMSVERSMFFDVESSIKGYLGVLEKRAE